MGDELNLRDVGMRFRWLLLTVGAGWLLTIAVQVSGVGRDPSGARAILALALLLAILVFKVTQCVIGIALARSLGKALLGGGGGRPPVVLFFGPLLSLPQPGRSKARQAMTGG